MYGINGRLGGIWTHALCSAKQLKVPMVELYKTNGCPFSKDLIAVLINVIQYADSLLWKPPGYLTNPDSNRPTSIFSTSGRDARSSFMVSAS